MSQDEQRIIVCNGGSKSVEVLSSKDLKKMGGFSTGSMHPMYAHEIRAFGEFEEEEAIEETIEEELVEEIVAEEIAVEA